MAEKKEQYFYINGKVSGAVTIGVVDNEGKPVPVTKNGAQVFNKKGEPVYRTRSLIFREELSDLRGNTRCMYKTSDPYEIDHLNKMAEDQSQGVMTYEQRRKAENKEAYAVEVKMNEYKSTAETLLAENARVMEELDSKKDVESKNETLLAEIAALKKKYGVKK